MRTHCFLLCGKVLKDSKRDAPSVHGAQGTWGSGGRWDRVWERLQGTRCLRHLFSFSATWSVTLSVTWCFHSDIVSDMVSDMCLRQQGALDTWCLAEFAHIYCSLVDFIYIYLGLTLLTVQETKPW